MEKKIITSSNGQEVYCYGKWEEDSNCFCVFDNEELDGPYCEGGNSWKEVVETLTRYAEENGTTLIELQAM